jgi:hypothetical protein
MRSVTVVVLLLLATAAHADPWGFLSAGPTLGGDGAQNGLVVGAVVDTGVRIGSTWWLHGHFGESLPLASGTDRAFTDLRAGFLAEPCHGGSRCWFIGIDAGYRTGYRSGIIVTPQLGVDIALGNFHVRPDVEFTIGPPDPLEDVPVPDFGLTVAGSIAYEW